MKLTSFSKQNRWFMTPLEALNYMRSENTIDQKQVPVNKLTNIYKKQNSHNRNQIKPDSEIDLEIKEEDTIPYKRVFEHQHS